MKKNNFLLIGYSHIARKRIIEVFLKNKIEFSVASKSFKEKIKGVRKQFLNYEDALLNSDASIVYISLPNALHFYWAKKALLLGYHVVIDKPICYKISETRELIKIAKKNNKFLSEAIFYNYHAQIKKVIKILPNKKINLIKVDFIIPTPPKSSLLMSNKLKGGVIMDMGPYASSIHRIFFNKKIIYTKIDVKKNRQNLPKSFKLEIKYENKRYIGSFKFGGKYINKVVFFTNEKKITINRVFSPPDDLNLNLEILEGNKEKTLIIKKDNCFENYLFEIITKINKKKYSYYYKQIEQDHLFRDKIEKKFLKTI